MNDENVVCFTGTMIERNEMFDRVKKVAEVYKRLIDQGIRCHEQGHCTEFHEMTREELNSTNPELVCEELVEHVRMTLQKLKDAEYNEPHSNS